MLCPIRGTVSQSREHWWWWLAKSFLDCWAHFFARCLATRHSWCDASHLDGDQRDWVSVLRDSHVKGRAHSEHKVTRQERVCSEPIWLEHSVCLSQKQMDQHGRHHEARPGKEGALHAYAKDILACWRLSLCWLLDGSYANCEQTRTGARGAVYLDRYHRQTFGESSWNIARLLW